MSKKISCHLISIRSAIALVCFCCISLSLNAQNAQNDLLTMLRKIKVDHQGTAGACDGSAFNTKGDIVAASDNTGLTKLFRVSDGSLVSTIKHNEGEVSAQDGETNVIHFTPDDKFFITGMNLTGAKIWNVETKEMIKGLGHGQNTDGAAFSPDGKWVAVAHDRFCAVYSLWDYKKVAEFSVIQGETNAVDWTEDSSHFMFCGGGGSVRIVRTKDWKLLHEITFPASRVKSVAISPDAKLGAACGKNGIVQVYDLMDGALVADLRHNTSTALALPGDDNDGKQPNVEAVEWSTDSKYFFTGGTYDGIIRIWRVADWSLIGWVQGQEYSRQVETLSMNPENILASGGDEGYLYLFQFNPPAEKKVIQQSGDQPISIEAEDFDANVAQGSNWWSVIDDKKASGKKKVQCFPDLFKDETGVISQYVTNDPRKGAPKLDYRVNFTTPGVYHVWARGRSYDKHGNSIHVGINGTALVTADKLECLGKDNTWIWDKETRDKAPATIEIKEAGLVTINVWPREDGIQLDKLILTLDTSFKPEDLGPEASTRK